MRLFFIYQMEIKSNKNLNENFEAGQNLTGFFRLLLEIDKRNNPNLYENNRDTNNTNKSE